MKRRPSLELLDSDAGTQSEVAAGAGFVPAKIRELLSPNLDLKITLLDRARTHLNGSSRAIAGDACALPFADNSFDLVSSNLFVHHLAPDELQQFAREAVRVCRVAFIINDVVRDPMHLALTYAGFPLYRSRITRNDAPASVRQA